MRWVETGNGKVLPLKQDAIILLYRVLYIWKKNVISQIENDSNAIHTQVQKFN